MDAQVTPTDAECKAAAKLREAHRRLMDADYSLALPEVNREEVAKRAREVRDARKAYDAALKAYEKVDPRS
jgi:hypothetical protein